MKKLLIALLMAGVLGGAVYGAAANINLTAPNVGAGDAQISTCAATTSVSSTYVISGGFQVIDSITVTTTGTCTTENVTVTLTGAGTLSPATVLGPSAMTAGAITFSSLAANGDRVSDWTDVHVLING